MISTTILGPEWNLSPDGLDSITNRGTTKDPKQCLKNALDSDLKSIGKSALSNLTSANSKIVLQIAKIRNVAAPKANDQSQAAPRMLKLTLTDGDSYVQAIEVQPVTSLSRDKTAPGTKCLIDGAKLVNGFLLIDNRNFKILGGHVEHLFDKWQLAKNVKKDHVIGGSSGAAPPWVPFGHKMAPKLKEAATKEATNVKNEASEFELQRKEAIMEVSSGAVRKTFGGRVRQNVVSVPQQQQKYVKNDRNSRKSYKMEEDDVTLQRPSEKVSLFSFLEDKLPQTEKQQPNKKSNNFEFRQQNGFVKTNNVATAQQYSQNRDKNPNSYQKPRNVATAEETRQPSNSVANSYQKSRNTQQNVATDGRKSNVNNLTTLTTDDVANSHKKPRNTHQNLATESDARKSNVNNLTTLTANDVVNSHKKPKNVTRDDHMSNVNLSTSMSKMSLNDNNGEFATRAFRNHLNLPPVAPSSGDLKVGDQCMAKYWEDGKLYPASVAAVTDRTYAVRFRGYGNIEEVLRQDCFPVNVNRNDNYRGNSMEFRNNRRRN